MITLVIGYNIFGVKITNRVRATVTGQMTVVYCAGKLHAAKKNFQALS